MGQTIGDLLPLALGVAISPIPIIAVILMLLAPKAGATSLGFAAGWVVGVAVATTIFVVIAGTQDLGTSSEPSKSSSWIKLVLGLLLLSVGLRQWRGRPKGDEEPHLPKWMAAIDSFNAVKAAGLAFLLAAVNPKNLLLCAAAGATIGGKSLTGEQETWSVVIFTLLAASTVLVPVIAYLLAKKQMAAPLDRLKVWLTANNAVVMSVLILVIGVMLFGKGLGGLL